jgi:hypothetical protein
MHHSELREGGQLDRLIEDFLTREFEVIVDFDLEDALSRLKADQLVSESADGVITAMTPLRACQHLEQQWRTLLSQGDVDQQPVAYEAEV